MKFVICVSIKTKDKNNGKYMDKNIEWPQVRPEIGDIIVIDGIDSKVKECSINFVENSFTVDLCDYELQTIEKQREIISKLEKKGWHS